MTITRRMQTFTSSRLVAFKMGGVWQFGCLPHEAIKGYRPRLLSVLLIGSFRATGNLKSLSLAFDTSCISFNHTIDNEA